MIDYSHIFHKRSLYYVDGLTCIHCGAIYRIKDTSFICHTQEDPYKNISPTVCKNYYKKYIPSLDAIIMIGFGIILFRIFKT